MSSTSSWYKTSMKLTTDYLNKYGHLLKWKGQKENILDIGCADGSVIRNVLYPYIESHVYKLLAIDKLQSMIDFAKERNLEEKIEFQVMDVMDNRIVEELAGKFDHIFALFVAHWIPDNKAFLNGLYKMLKPNGQIFLDTIVSHPITLSFEKHFKEGTWSKYLLNRIFVDYTEDPVNFFRNTVEDAGFEVDICERDQGTYVTEDLPDMVRTIVLMSETMNSIPKELQESYMEDHIRNTCECSKYLREPNVYDVPYDTIICIASKNV